jgi:hypothetical protein
MTDFNLNDFMEFDHVVEVKPGGEVTDAPGVHGPGETWVKVDDDGQMVSLDPAAINIDNGQGWSLLTGFSGQHGYSGPIMHSSEVVGGGLERYIVSHPGFYVVTEVLGSPPPGDEGGWDPVGWAVAYRER